MQTTNQHNLKSDLIIGVDIGGTRTKYGLVNMASGEVVKNFVLPTERKAGAIFLEQIGVVIKDCREFTEQTNATILGIGFGIPGFTSQNGEVLTTYGFLEFMENYPLKTMIESNFQLPCLMDNDARIVCLGEALYGKGKGYKRVLTLTLGTGVGFGLVVNHQFMDVLPLAHMGGHLKITDEGGECYCGKTGCLESLVASSAIIKLAETRGLSTVKNAEDVFEAAWQNDDKAIEVIDKVVGYLHTAIHNYVNLFAPDIVVLGGGVAKGLIPYVDKIKGRGYMGPYPAYDFQLAISELGELAGMLGSAALFQTLKEAK